MIGGTYFLHLVDTVLSITIPRLTKAPICDIMYFNVSMNVKV